MTETKDVLLPADVPVDELADELGDSVASLGEEGLFNARTDRFATASDEVGR